MAFSRLLALAFGTVAISAWDGGNMKLSFWNTQDDECTDVPYDTFMITASTAGTCTPGANKRASIFLTAGSSCTSGGTMNVFPTSAFCGGDSRPVKIAAKQPVDSCFADQAHAGWELKCEPPQKHLLLTYYTHSNQCTPGGVNPSDTFYLGKPAPQCVDGTAGKLSAIYSGTNCTSGGSLAIYNGKGCTGMRANMVPILLNAATQVCSHDSDNSWILGCQAGPPLPTPRPTPVPPVPTPPTPPTPRPTPPPTPPTPRPTPPPTYSPTPAPPTPMPTYGGVVGGLFACAALAGVFVWHRRRTSSSNIDKAALLGAPHTTPHAPMAGTVPNTNNPGHNNHFIGSQQRE
jgi:hypothetical protein